MKATGEVMAIGRTFEESLLKAVRSLETGVNHLYDKKFDTYTYDELMEYIKIGTDDRLFAIAELLYHGADINMIYDNTKIDMFFLEKIKHIVDFEEEIKAMNKSIKNIKKMARDGYLKCYN